VPRKPTLAATSISIALLALCGAGCALRTSHGHDYFGPTLLRVGDDTSNAEWSETRQIGLVLEAGTQWGLSFGSVDRFQATAIEGPPAADERPQEPVARWERWLGTLRPIGNDGWCFSPFWARGHDVPKPEFVRRRLVGAQAIAGREGAALSLGWVMRTNLWPRRDALSSFLFDDAHPDATRFLAWPAGDGDALPTGPILEEVQFHAEP